MVDTEALKSGVDLASLVGHYTALKKRGAEYVGLCVAHADKKPSMWVNPNKGFVHCFSCGFNADAIEFVMHMEGMDFKAACEHLGAKPTWTPRAPVEQLAPARPDRTTSAPPPHAGEPPMTIRGLGAPSRTWAYRDTAGLILGYVARYETDEGKQIRCWTWGARGAEEPGWGCGHWNAPRPLYGLDRLAARPDAFVLVVEGEKAADAAAALLGAYVVVTWPGGAQSWHRAGWEALKGRQVLLWPDNDAGGIECMQKLAALLSDPRGLACTVKLIDPSGMVDGFDAADWTLNGEELIEWAKPRATLYGAAAIKAETPSPETEQPVSTIASTPPEEAQPPVEAYAEDAARASTRKPQRSRPRLHAVDGNAALAPTEDVEALPAAMSEDAIASAFAEVHAERWRYVKPWGSWFEWRGDGWYRDDTAKIDRLAVEITRQAIYWPEAAVLTPDGKRKVNSRRTAGNVRDIALSDRSIAATVDQWDTDPWLLGVPGGVVNLRDGTLHAPRPHDYITKRTRTAPEPGSAPIWLQFLSTVTDGKPELISFLQRFAGYSLTGETREQCLAFLYGTGQNGKGVFITTLANILGDYATACDADVFMESDQQRHPTEMARLRGARLVTIDETDSSKRWNEKRIKRITGGGRIEARFMRQDDFEFTPQFKLLIAGNHKPQLRGVGKAIQRRIHLVPFTVTIPDADRDDELAQKLEAEYPQILQWAIDGCKSWIAEGLAAPAEVLEATSRYIEGEDVIGEWLEERTDQKGSAERPRAYKNYRGWMEGRGERPWSSKAFWAALEEKGYTAKKSNGAWSIQGLQLRFNEPSADSEPPTGYPFPD